MGAALGSWALVSVLVVGTLMVGHTAAMPGPVSWAGTDAGLLKVDGAPTSVVHVVPANCSCTDGLVRHLIARGKRADVSELVLFVGEPTALHRSVVEAGYRLQVMPATELNARLGLTAGPVLAVRRQGRLSYLGGYFRYPAAVRSLDESLIDDTLAGRLPDALPLFGCAVDPALLGRVDPLGLGR